MVRRYMSNDLEGICKEEAVTKFGVTKPTTIPQSIQAVSEHGTYRRLSLSTTHCAVWLLTCCCSLSRTRTQHSLTCNKTLQSAFQLQPLRNVLLSDAKRRHFTTMRLSAVRWATTHPTYFRLPTDCRGAHVWIDRLAWRRGGRVAVREEVRAC